MNIHERVREKVELADTYARDGAFFSAARTLEGAIKLYREHGQYCMEQEVEARLNDGK